MNKAEYVQTVLAHMHSNRFPKEAWNKIDKIIEDYQNNKITLEERDSQIYLIADAYDSIKPSERWWENNARPNTTQQRVLNYINEFGSITSLEACVDIGETRLSARIFELKDKGVNIGAEWIEVTNRYGEKRLVKKYFIV